MARLPISRVVCTDPGRSTSKIFSLLAGGGPCGKLTATFDLFHAASHTRSFGTRVAACTSPEMARIVFCGAYCFACHSASIAGVSESRDSGVAETTAAGYVPYNARLIV